MQKTIILLTLMALNVLTALAQGTVKGKIKDLSTDETMQFVNITVTQAGETKMLKGAITDEAGNFSIAQLPYGDYQLNVSFMGYKPHAPSVKLR